MPSNKSDLSDSSDISSSDSEESSSQSSATSNLESDATSQANNNESIFNTSSSRKLRNDVVRNAMEQPVLYGVRRSGRNKRESVAENLVFDCNRKRNRISSSEDNDTDTSSYYENSSRHGKNLYKKRQRRKAGRRSFVKNIDYREASDDETNSEDLIVCQHDNVNEENNYDTIERIMTHRHGVHGATGVKTVIYAETKDIQNTSNNTVTEKQYLIKWKGWSHLHNTWESKETLYEQKANKLGKIDSYEKRQIEFNHYKKFASAEDIEFVECQMEMMQQLREQYTLVDRIVCKRMNSGERIREKYENNLENHQQSRRCEYFVKWCGLPYFECSWEDTELIERLFPNEVSNFERLRNISLPSFKETCMWHDKSQFKRITEQPSYIGGNNPSLKLRDYQLDGLNWLTQAWVKHHGCILADEMGLGKTIQTISLLSVLMNVYNVPGPFLLVVPLSTIMTWQKEFSTWAPDMNVIVYLGDSRSRETIRKYEWHQVSNRRLKFHVLITTYELLSKDKQDLATIQWALLAVDEAHRLKNDDCQLYKYLISFTTGHRLLITGTPLQNSLRELWSLLHFIMPNKFDDWLDFEQRYSWKDDERDKTTLCRSNFISLHRRLEPYLLRRVKKDVEKSLPSKTEQILRVQMTNKQKQFYKWILTKNYNALSKGVKGSITGFINIVMELKKCCNHPYLVRMADQGINSESFETLVKSSGKLILLDKLLLRLREGGHRVLIFSQMVMMLDILAEYLQRRRFPFQRLDGTIKSEQRRQAMDHFNAEGSQDFCFLLSTKAGGLGVNLATADTVIIFDSDWNPQNDLQAQARAHRIGQKKQVSVYRLVTKNSVEEEILERAKKKMVLDHLVIQSMDTTGRAVLNTTKERQTAHQFNKDELSAILKFGAEELFKENEYEDDDVVLDDILLRAETHSTEDHSTGAEELLSQFKVVNFDNLEHEEIENDRAKDWDSIIPESELNKIREEEREETLRNLKLGPRIRKNVNYEEGQKETNKKHIAKKRQSTSDNDDDNENSSKKKRGRVGYFKNMNMADVRQFIKSFKKYPRPLERIADIANDADLKTKNIQDLKKLGERLIESCEEAMLDYEDQRKKENDIEIKKVNKGPTINFGSIQVKVKQILSSLDDLEVLARSLPVDKLERRQFKLTINTKAAHWDCDWTISDDSAFLRGIYNHGLGNWELIKLDSDLGLQNKLLPHSDLKPQAKHLNNRFDYLVKVLRKHNLHNEILAKRPRKKRQKKETKGSFPGNSTIIPTSISSNEAKEEKIAIINKTVITESPDMSIQKMETSEKKQKNNKQKNFKETKPIEQQNIQHSKCIATGEDDIGTNDELTEQEFNDCKDKMRPVKKALKRLDTSEDNPNLTKDQKVYRAQQLLLEIGDHINNILKNVIDPMILKILRANLWKFVSKFTDKPPTKLYKMYKHSVKKRREREQNNVNSNGRSSEIYRGPIINNPSNNNYRIDHHPISAYTKPPEFYKHKSEYGRISQAFHDNRVSSNHGNEIVKLHQRNDKKRSYQRHRIRDKEFRRN